jgi:mRNA interferase RelE/StbE
MNIEFDKSFSKSIDKLRDSKIKKRIEHIIYEFEKAEKIIDIRNVKKLTGFQFYYRIRIGDYRLGVELKNPRTVRFIVISHRKDIYRIFP